jgi:hypothetical protein
MFWKTVLATAAIGRSRVAGLILGCALVAGLAACAVQALQYDEPDGDQTAEFVVSTDGPMALLFYRDAARCTDALQVPQPKAGVTAYRIPANREFAFKFTYFTGDDRFWTACPEEILSFYPEKAGQYRLHYMRNGDRPECRWTLTENRGGREMAVKVSERESDSGFTSFEGEGAWCKPKGAP